MSFELRETSRGFRCSTTLSLKRITSLCTLNLKFYSVAVELTSFDYVPTPELLSLKPKYYLKVSSKTASSSQSPFVPCKKKKQSQSLQSSKSEGESVKLGRATPAAAKTVYPAEGARPVLQV